MSAATNSLPLSYLNDLNLHTPPVPIIKKVLGIVLIPGPTPEKSWGPGPDGPGPGNAAVCVTKYFIVI
jgi:hypothetical protein